MRLTESPSSSELEPIPRTNATSNDGSHYIELNVAQVSFAAQRRSLYLSHALTTWQARTYEFAAVGAVSHVPHVRDRV